VPKRALSAAFLRPSTPSLELERPSPARDRTLVRGWEPKGGMYNGARRDPVRGMARCGSWMRLAASQVPRNRGGVHPSLVCLSFIRQQTVDILRMAPPHRRNRTAWVR
jgi:hypothetical protein